MTCTGRNNWLTAKITDSRITPPSCHLQIFHNPSNNHQRKDPVWHEVACLYYPFLWSNNQTVCRVIILETFSQDSISKQEYTILWETPSSAQIWIKMLSELASYCIPCFWRTLVAIDLTKLMERTNSSSAQQRTVERISNRPCHLAFIPTCTGLCCHYKTITWILTWLINTNQDYAILYKQKDMEGLSNLPHHPHPHAICSLSNRATCRDDHYSGPWTPVCSPWQGPGRIDHGEVWWSQLSCEDIMEWYRLRYIQMTSNDIRICLSLFFTYLGWQSYPFFVWCPVPWQSPKAFRGCQAFHPSRFGRPPRNNPLWEITKVRRPCYPSPPTNGCPRGKAWLPQTHFKQPQSIRISFSKSFQAANLFHSCSFDSTKQRTS